MFNWIKSKLGFLKNQVYLKVLLVLGKTLLGSRWKGARTLAAGFAVFIIGLFEWISDSGLYDLLCQANENMCNIEQSTFYGVILTIIGGLQQLLRVVTDSSVDPEINT